MFHGKPRGPAPREPSESWAARRRARQGTGAGIWWFFYNSWYLLVTLLDAFSRYVVHWALLPSMTAQDVRGVIQAALEQTGAHPQTITANDSQFTAGEFRPLVRHFALEHVRIRTLSGSPRGEPLVFVR